MLSKPGRWSGLAWMLMAAGSMIPNAFGQGNTFNPYGNSGYRDYREFTQPMYSNDPSLPGQARLQGGGGSGTSRANQFEAYTNSLEGRDPDGLGSLDGLRSRPGVPYNRSYRQYDEQYKRVYTPNANADKEFGDRIRDRGLAYDRAIAEKDPVVRARLLRQLDLDNLDRPKPPTGRAGAKGAAPKATAKAGTSAAAAPVARPPQSRFDAASPAARPRANPAPRATRPAAKATTPAATQPPTASTSATTPDPASVPIPPPPR